MENRNIPDIVLFGNTLYNEEFKLICRLELPNGRENNLHYDRIIENWVNIRIQGIREGNYLGDRNQWMEDYIDGYFREFLDFLLNIAKHANSYHYNQDNKSKSRYTQGYLKLFRFFESDLGMTSLELNTFRNERQAVKMQDYLLARIDEIGSMLKSDFFIDINRNPIMVHVKEYKDRIQNSLDFERLKYRSEEEFSQKEEPHIFPTKSDILFEKLTEYGFYKLPKVSCLSFEKQKELTKLISKQKRPKFVAFIDFLGFVEYTKENYSGYNLTKNALLLEKIFNEGATDGSEMEKTIRSLVKESSCGKYKAINHKVFVTNLYQKL